MTSCLPENGYRDCNFKRTGSLDSCHEPGGCLAGQDAGPVSQDGQGPVRARQLRDENQQLEESRNG